MTTCKTRINAMGERLHPIKVKGRQWAVTSYGVECLDGTYAICRSRLFEEHPGWTWEWHIAGKNWSDASDFATIIAKARMRYPAGTQPVSLRRWSA